MKNGDRLVLRRDEPHLPPARREVLAHLAVHLLVKVIRRNDLHRQIRSHRPDAFRFAFRRDARRSNERDIRQTLVVPDEKRGIRTINAAQAVRFNKVDELAEKVDGLAEKVDKLADAQLKYEARTSRLEESFLILVQLAQSTDQRLDALTEAQLRTDENIKNLTAVVDRYFSEGRNGKP